MARKIIFAADILCRRAALAAIGVYQFLLSPWLGGQCRFYPTCSQYAKTAFRRHSFPRALWLTVRRLGRCHPFCRGGVDMPPAAKRKIPTALAGDEGGEFGA